MFATAYPASWLAFLCFAVSFHQVNIISMVVATETHPIRRNMTQKHDASVQRNSCWALYLLWNYLIKISCNKAYLLRKSEQMSFFFLYFIRPSVRPCESTSAMAASEHQCSLVRWVRWTSFQCLEYTAQQIRLARGSR